MYRKFKADAIFTGSELLPESQVLITEGDGKVVDVVSQQDAGGDVESLKGIITPGFINCHCHIELSYLKNRIPIHTGLSDFVRAVLSARDCDPEIKSEAMETAAKELYESGTVAVGDICNDAASVDFKRKSPIHWTNFIEVSGFVNSTAAQRFAAAQVIAEKFSALPFPYAIVPHAPYSVSENLFKLINDHTKCMISIHNQESAAEDELFLQKQGAFLTLYDQLGIDITGFQSTGKSSLQTWVPYFTHKQKILSVHNTFINQSDLDFANNLIYCICINANLYIENKLPPVDLLRNNNCKIVMGTDSYASNHQLNMIEEMKSIQKNFPGIQTETILGWATLHGAEALGISDTYGSFTGGAMPGVVIVEHMAGNLFSERTSARRLV